MRAIALGCFALATVFGSVVSGPASAQSSAFLSANLLGQEVPGGKGDDKAGANFNGEFKLRQNQVCYYLDMDGLDDANGVFIKSSKDKEPEPAPAPPPAADPAAVVDPAAAPAEAAPAPAPAPSPSLALKVPGPDGDEVCVSGDKSMIEQIAAAPADYYVEIVTPGHPNGAVRGTLKK
jgi:hypothetical protein